MKKISIKIPKWVIVTAVIILAAGLISTFVRASGRFNLPLSWILTSSGTSIDTNNDGLVDFDRFASGIIIIFDSDCPANWTRVSDLDGKFLVASSTYNAAAGGSDSITLAEANLPSHTHGVGTLAAANESAHTHGDGSLTTNNTGASTHTVSGTAASNGNHTHSDYTYSSAADPSGTTRLWADWADSSPFAFGSATGAHTHTVSGTAASNGNHTHTISGTTAAGSAHTHTLSGSTGGTGSGTAFDNRPAYATIVICKKD